MSKQSIYDELKIPESHIPVIKGFTQQSQEQIYSATIRAWLQSFGFPDQSVTVSDPEVIDALDTWASEQANRIYRVFNEYLLREITRMPEDFTDEQIIAALEADFFPRTRGYNRDVLVPYTSNWTRQRATDDFFERNGLHTQTLWSCEPPIVTDQSCDNCITAIDESPMSWLDMQQYEMPNHQRCPHNFVPNSLDFLTLPEPPWTGQSQYSQEAA